MGCCCTKKPVGEESAYDNNGKKSGVSPAATRKCRDVLCCLFFLVFWVGMIIVAIIGLLNGQPKRLLYGSDRNGTTCGTGHLVDKPLTFYPRMNEDLLEQAVNPKLKPIDFEFTGYCVSVCPLQYSYFCNYEFEDSLAADTTLKTEVDRDAKRKAEANKILGEKNCWFVAMPNEKVFYRCIQMTQTNSTSVETCIYPADAPEFYETVNGIKRPNALCEVKTVRTISDATGPAQVSPIYDKLQTSAAMVGRALGDIQNSWPVVLVIGGGVAFALGFVFLLLMKYFAGCVVWITLWSFVLMLLLFSLMLSTKAGIIDDSQMGQLSSKLSDAGLVTATQNGFQVPDNLRASNDKQKIYRIAAYVSYGLTGVAFLLVCFFQKKVRIAVGIIKEASRAIQRMPLLLLFPIVPFLMIVVLFIYSAIIAAFIYSIGDVIKLDKLGGSAATTSATVFNKVSANDTMRILVAYHFFGFLWTNQLINAISMCTIAGAVCRYYWSREKSAAEMGRFPVLYSFKNCFRYHFGSLAFGSFIIAVVQFIRAILMYIDHQTQDLQNGNLIIKVMMKVVQCCLWCLEKCLKFLSKNAYIMIAMNGKSFCVSAKDSFKLLFSNLGQIATVSLVSYLLVLAAKVAIAIACAVIAFAYIEKNQIKYGIGGTNEISSPMAPILLTLLLAWFVASTLLGVYEMAIDTILLCFCEDKEMNKATGMYFMSEHLQKFIASVPATGNIQGGGGATASPPASPGTGNI